MRLLPGLIVVVFVAACDDFGPYVYGEFPPAGGGGANPPVITNLHFIPESATIGEGDGSLDVHAEFDYAYDYEDLNIVVDLFVMNDEGNEYSLRFYEWEMESTGTLQYPFNVSTIRAQMYSVKARIFSEPLIYSNILQADFVVHAP